MHTDREIDTQTNRQKERKRGMNTQIDDRQTDVQKDIHLLQSKYVDRQTVRLTDLKHTKNSQTDRQTGRQTE